jgi:DNA repair ATPase RecN
MIKNLNIYNFQSHQLSSLDFDPGVNVIVGASDSGKTAILRALRWLIWNRPGGDAFRSTWGGDTEVTLETETDRISRCKGKENEYIINDETLKAFGSDVPQEIQEALNIDETNLQQQLDSPFLISETPGEVAKYFNRIAHLDQIDQGLLNLNQELRKIENKKGFLIEEKKEVEEAVKAYEYLDKAEIDLEALEIRDRKHKNKIVSSNRLRHLITSLSSINSSIGELSKMTDLADEVGEILNRIKAIKSKKEDAHNISSSINSARTLSRNLKEINDLIALEPEIDEVLSKIQYKEKLVEEAFDLKNIITLIEDNANQLITKQSNIITMEHEFAIHMPEICPLCGSDLAHEKNGK